MLFKIITGWFLEDRQVIKPWVVHKIVERDREKSYYLVNVPLKRSIPAEKEVHGTGKICLTKISRFY